MSPDLTKIPHLSIKQPYLHWIQCGMKTYEIRSWSTEHRGDLVLCSSKIPAAFSNLHKLIYQMKFPLGKALCIVELVDIVPFMPELAVDAMSEWKPDHYAWKIRFKQNLDPIPVKGRLGLFYHDYVY